MRPNQLQHRIRHARNTREKAKAIVQLVKNRFDNLSTIQKLLLFIVVFATLGLVVVFLFRAGIQRQIHSPETVPLKPITPLRQKSDLSPTVLNNKDT